MSNDIFTKNFNGSIDDLLKHCGDNADLVNNVIEGKTDIILNDTDAIALIKSELHDIDGKYVSDESAKEILELIKLEQAKQVINELVSRGLLESKGYNTDGEEVFGLTVLGEEYNKKIKKKK
jgi:hypothetical protein